MGSPGYFLASKPEVEDRSLALRVLCSWIYPSYHLPKSVNSALYGVISQYFKNQQNKWKGVSVSLLQSLFLWVSVCLSIPDSQFYVSHCFSVSVWQLCFLFLLFLTFSKRWLLHGPKTCWSWLASKVPVVLISIVLLWFCI